MNDPSRVESIKAHQEDVRTPKNDTSKNQISLAHTLYTLCQSASKQPVKITF